MRRTLHPLLLLSAATLAAGCNPCGDAPGCLAAEDLAGGLLSVRAPASDEVWVVGASPDPADGTGPLLLEYDGGEWTRHDTSAWAGSELWWVFVDGTDRVFVGNDGLILHMDESGALTQQDGPTDDITFFGVWGGGDGDVWAVGQSDAGMGPPVIWRRQSGSWGAYEDSNIGPGEEGQRYFKMDGVAPDDAWIVGSDGITLHWDGTQLNRVSTEDALDNPATPLLTIDTRSGQPIAVGGFGNAVVLEWSGEAWSSVSLDFQPGYNGVCSNGTSTWAVGQSAARAERVEGAWITDRDKDATPLTVLDWHGCDVDPEGNLWTVGGRINARPLNQGVIGYQGAGSPKEPSL